MTERYTNDAATTLSAAMTTTDGPTCVVADALAFPSAGTFRIKIDGELLVVTDVAGNTFTVVRGAEGTTPATHAAGASVIHLLTKGGLEARTANRVIAGPYESKPVAGVRGRLFLPSDGLFLEYDDGAAWHQYGPYRQLVSPPQTGWQWGNQEAATATFLNGVLILEEPVREGSGANVRLLVRPVKQLPATITMAYFVNGGFTALTTTPFFGFCARSSGGNEDGQFTTMGVFPSSSNAQWYTSDSCWVTPTTSESGGLGSKYIGAYPTQMFWVRFVIDGSLKKTYYSADGVNWILRTSYTLATNSTPNQVGVFIDPRANAMKISVTLVHWEES